MGQIHSFSIENFTFQAGDKQIILPICVDTDNYTVWITAKEMESLFGKSRRTIGFHIENLYKEQELDKKSTWRKNRQVQKEGGRIVEREVDFYNLDVLISVGYRVKSQNGVAFRKWATQILKNYLLQGYALNDELLKKEQSKTELLYQEIDNLKDRNFQQEKRLIDGFISIIENYARSFELLNRYDSQQLQTNNLNTEILYIIDYQEAKTAIAALKRNLLGSGEASNWFGNEKDDSFKGILNSITQTIFGELAYPTVEAQAAQLLYSVIKGHSFTDGNKRIGSFIFVWFLEKNKVHLKKNKELKISDNALVAIALMVAQSLPEQRELVVQLIINFIKKQ